MIDLYRLLPEEWFDQIGDFSNDEEEFAPVDYDDVCTAFYMPNSFFGGEIVDLMVDDETKTYYIRFSIKQPIGDYGWQTVYGWYKSDPERYHDIKSIVEQAMKEDTNDGN